MSHKYILPERRIAEFRELILNWYKINKRELPWRKTRDPYKIMVSEFMLQQTQVNRVINYYEKFLQEFPTIFSLAKASQRDLLKLWSGLGYNRRALKLREAARVIVAKYDGQVPNDYTLLKELPGFGDYMASAIPAFAFNKKAEVVDANIRRVFILEFELPLSVTMPELKGLSGQLVPPRKSRIWFNALMDYGAALPKELKKKVPPLTKQAKFHGSMRQLRGKILRILTEEHSLETETFRVRINDDRFETVILDLRREGFLKIRKGRISL